MADPFERELEELVRKYSQDLTREITAIILRRLGVSAEPARGRASRAPQPARATRPAAARAAQAPKPEKRRARASAEQRTAAVDEVARVVEGSRGLSVGEIERASGLPRAAVASALKKLKDDGRVFMGGTRRFARYAATQAQADRASLDARGGG